MHCLPHSTCAQTHYHNPQTHGLTHSHDSRTHHHDNVSETVSENVCVRERECMRERGYRVPELAGHFPQKSSIIIGSFAKNDLQVQASYGSTLFLSYTLSHTHIHSQRQSLTHYHDDVSVNHVNVSDHVSVDYDNVSVHK